MDWLYNFIEIFSVAGPVYTADPFSTTALIGLAVASGGAGVGAGVQSSRQSAKASRKLARIEKSKSELRLRRENIRALRESQIALANSEVAAQAQGATESSGAIGSRQSIVSQTQGNLSFLRSQGDLNTLQTSASQQLIKARQLGQLGQAASGVSSILSSLGSGGSG